ncbi:MAG: hypothetical protein BWY75_00829 [bacterium ADurb.Bin425]|nr:MAG: hypothetical protein BWY75_00829 [bacterium ADurb.Bin425]
MSRFALRGFQPAKNSQSVCGDIVTLILDIAKHLHNKNERNQDRHNDKCNSESSTGNCFVLHYLLKKWLLGESFFSAASISVKAVAFPFR